MLYLLYLRRAEHHHYVPLLNLLKYLTFRTGTWTVVTAQLVVVAMGSAASFAGCRRKPGQGPADPQGKASERHIIEKAGTPTMGGLMILAGVLSGTLIWGDLTSVYVWVAIVVTALYGFLGFLDDYAKVAKQSTGRGHLRLDARLAVELLAVAVATGVHGPMIRPRRRPQTGGAGMSTSLAFPIFKALVINLGWFYLAFAGVVIVGAANAVNFTDGLDGLAIVPVMIAAAAFGVIAYLVGNHVFADYLQVHFVPGVGEMAVFCGALIGAGARFHHAGTTRRPPRSSWATPDRWRSGGRWVLWRWPASTRSCWPSSAASSWHGSRCR